MLQVVTDVNRNMMTSALAEQELGRFLMAVHGRVTSELGAPARNRLAWVSDVLNPFKDVWSGELGADMYVRRVSAAHGVVVRCFDTNVGRGKAPDAFDNLVLTYIEAVVDNLGYPVVITEHPQDTDVALGDDFTLVSAATAYDTSQWYRFGNGGWIAVAGEVDPSITVASAANNNVGEYRNEFTNQHETKSTTVATVTIV